MIINKLITFRISSLSNDNFLIIYSPHVIQDLYVFLSSVEIVFFILLNIPRIISI